jgi:amidophosphoribosyltransferase
VQKALGCDWLVYQDLDDLIDSVHRGNPEIREFDTSCFNGEYVTGDVDQAYLDRLSCRRNDGAKAKREGENSVIGLHNAG